MTRPLRLCSVLLASAVLLWPTPPVAAAPADRPNVLIILADDLGYSDLGCYGGEIRTPHIDRLAKAGARFTQCYNSARCCPSRASLMTGLYPSQAGIGDFTTGRPNVKRGPGYLGRLNGRCATIAEVLGPAGYACYYVGKWHLHPETGPIARGFDEFYGYTSGHSHDQYDAGFYTRLPDERKKEIDPPQGKFYATDVFNEYALEFLRQGQASGKPWFLFLGHSSPHFPVQAPAESADPYETIYRRGWDALRSERYERMKTLGIVDGDHWTLTDRALVPVDRDDIANGFPGQSNPKWSSLSDDRRADLARRMAVFAAMVEHVDRGVGDIVRHLRVTGDLDNTLIIFLSDNGACYEWGPFGFDGRSRTGKTILHRGDDLRRIGGPGTHHSYGSGWANLGNTPLRLYKHFTHEGGIGTPLIVHWPKRFDGASDWIRAPVHVMDILPTICDAAGAKYPSRVGDRRVLPVEGRSLLPVVLGERVADRGIGFDHQEARAWREGDWKIVWSKRMPREIEWELYNIAEDRCETRNIAGEHPARVQRMAKRWEQWARRVGVIWPVDAPIGRDGRPLRTGPTGAPSTRAPSTRAPSTRAPSTRAKEAPRIENRELRISCEVEAESSNGVIVAQGGREQGYAIHLRDGKIAFDVRIHGKVTRIESERTVPTSFRVSAVLTKKEMRLEVDGDTVAQAPSPGLIPVQPKDGLDKGFDGLTAAGDYEAPNRLQGRITKVEVKAEKR